MKKLIVGIVLCLVATAVYAACTTHTYMYNGRLVTCTTCCDSFGNCTTNCFKGVNMERRFRVLDGDGEVIRTFLTKAEAINFMEKRPEFTLLVAPKEPKEQKPDLYEQLGECLL